MLDYTVPHFLGISGTLLGEPRAEKVKYFNSRLDVLNLLAPFRICAKNAVDEISGYPDTLAFPVTRLELESFCGKPVKLWQSQRPLLPT